MNNDFEPVLNSLLSSLQTSVGSSFVTMSRRAKAWADAESDIQPALFIRHIGDSDEYSDHSIFATTTMYVEVWIYMKASGDPDIAPDTAFNALLKLVRNAFKSDDPNTGRFTLGQTVHWCRIEGHSLIDDGAEDGQCAAMLPVHITLP